MNIVEHVSFLPVGTSSGYMHRRGIAGFPSNAMSNFLRNHQTDFQNGCTSLQFHQQWMTVPLSPHPCQHLLSHEFLILAIPTSVRWNSPQQRNGYRKCGTFKQWSTTQDHRPLLPLMYNKAILCYICNLSHGSLHVYSLVDGQVPGGS
jgi:hypothetical protein